MASDKAYNTMVQCITDPQPEGGLGEEHVFLAKYVELRISIKYSCGHKLVEDADNKWRKDSENDIVQ